MLSACALAAAALSIDPAALAQGTEVESCHIDYHISAQFHGGFIVDININNTGTTSISSWTLTWTFADGQTIQSFFNGIEKQAGANVSVKNQSYNGNIPAGHNLPTALGFVGNWNSITNSIPASFAVNGTVCN
jgi:hypothetical protein